MDGPAPGRATLDKLARKVNMEDPGCQPLSPPELRRWLRESGLAVVTEDGAVELTDKGFRLIGAMRP